MYQIGNLDRPPANPDEGKGVVYTNFDSRCLVGLGLPASIELALLSGQRATMAAMRHDPVNAALWALASFDPALVHFAELREKTSRSPKLDTRDEELENALNRALTVYLDGQIDMLRQAANINIRDFNEIVDEALGSDPNIIGMRAAQCSDDPLMMQLVSYALHLGTLTGHARAPWKRFSRTIEDCYAQHFVQTACRFS
jgi:hypothetical protein